jgi:hypothetical protein
MNKFLLRSDKHPIPNLLQKKEDSVINCQFSASSTGSRVHESLKMMDAENKIKAKLANTNCKHVANKTMAENIEDERITTLCKSKNESAIQYIPGHDDANHGFTHVIALVIRPDKCEIPCNS